MAKCREEGSPLVAQWADEGEQFEITVQRVEA
jgi:hypothetical protein